MNRNEIDYDSFIDSRKIPHEDPMDPDLDLDSFRNASSNQNQEEDFPEIPPIGIAKPELVEKAFQHIEKPQELKSYIDELERYERETPYESIKRESAAHTARGFENLSGYYGEMQDFASSLLGIDYPEREQPSKEELMTFFPDMMGMEGPDFSKKFPTTAQLREKSKEEFGQYLEPKSDRERDTQEIAGDIGTLFAMPGGLSTIQKLIFPFYGMAGKKVAKGMGAEESTQNLVKNLVMGTTTLLGNGNAPRIAAQAYNDAVNMMPRGLSFNANPTIQAFRNIRNSDWWRSGPTPAKRPAMQMLRQIERQIQRGNLNGRMAMQLRRDLNDFRYNMGGFNVPYRDRRGAIRYLNEIDDALVASMESYGTNVNPTWWNAYQDANNAYAVTRRSQALSEYIHNNFGGKLVSDTAKYLLIPSLGLGATQLGMAGIAAGGAALAMKTIQIGNRILRSNILRRHYAEVLRQASLGNAKNLKDAIEAFDKASLKYENQNMSKKASPNL